MKRLLICCDMFLRWASVVLYFVILISLALVIQRTSEVSAAGTIAFGVIGVLGVIFARIPIALIYFLFLSIGRSVIRLPKFITDLVTEVCDWVMDYAYTVRLFLFSSEDPFIL